MTEEKKRFIRWCVLGAIGGILMAAGDWLLGCIPIRGDGYGHVQQSLLSVRRLWPVETCADRRDGRDRGLSLFLYGKSDE